MLNAHMTEERKKNHWEIMKMRLIPNSVIINNYRIVTRHERKALQILYPTLLMAWLLFFFFVFILLFLLFLFITLVTMTPASTDTLIVTHTPKKSSGSFSQTQHSARLTLGLHGGVSGSEMEVTPP